MNAGTSSNAPRRTTVPQRCEARPVAPRRRTGRRGLPGRARLAVLRAGGEAPRTHSATAIADYLDAQDELEALEQEQVDLEQELADSEVEAAALRVELEDYAFVASTTSDLQSTAALMSSGDPQDAIAAMELLQFLGESRATGSTT